MLPTKKRSKTKELTQDRLKSLLNYNPATGEFTWLVNQGTRGRVGDVAGGLWTGRSGKSYFYIKIAGKTYSAHRLAWLYFYGEWPKDQIDHIDQNSLNNRLNNLRDVTHAQNQKNQKIPKNNNSGTIGVYFCRRDQRWETRIQVNRKSIYLGSFKLKEDAITARKEAEVKYGFHPNHGNT